MHARTVVVGWILLAGCGDNLAPAPFELRGSFAQVHIMAAPPATALEVVDGADAVVGIGTTDSLGSLIVRDLGPGDGYRVRIAATPTVLAGPVTVLDPTAAPPPESFYQAQALDAGYHYITTRDGTTLSAYVTFPAGPPPYPTVVSYSGYAPSKPGAPLADGTFIALCDALPVMCDAPNDPSAMFAAMLGYATVNVNMRGTGCSGGAFDFFEAAQLLDGYDVIETVAAQPWVAGGEVGMVGLSYPGLSQLFVASTQPPHLAAIAPMSTIGAAHTTMLPGGMLNVGFAEQWIANVLSQAAPYGQGWEQARVDGGDQTCADNQRLHGQLVDNVQQAREVVYYEAAAHDRYNLDTLVGAIEAPVFLASAWQDEQTGPYFFTMFDALTAAVPALRVTTYNGVHVDAYQPDVLSEWWSFLELFVAKRVPVDSALVRDLSPEIFRTIFGVGRLNLEPSRFAGYATHAEALAAWQAEPRFRALFESGAGDAVPGAPMSTFALGHDRWPPAEVVPTRLYAQPDGSLAAAPPVATNAASRFEHDPDAGMRSMLSPGGDVWALLPAWAWTPPAPGAAVVFEGPVLAADTVMMGTASFDLWLRAPIADAELEVSISEVRPDGQEMFVQGGWLRASRRGSGPAATVLWPAPTFAEPEAAPLEPGVWTPVRVGTAGFHHVFRAGSRVRVMIDTPGDSRAEWFFQLAPVPAGTAYDIGHDQAHPTSVVFPIVPGVEVPSPLPPCPSLRGQPCRETAAYVNTPAI